MEGILSGPVSCSLSTYWYFCSEVSVNSCISKAAFKITYQNANSYVVFIAEAEHLSLALESSSIGEEGGVCKR